MFHNGVPVNHGSETHDFSIEFNNHADHQNASPDEVHIRNQHTSLFSVFSRSTGSSFLFASIKSAYLSDKKKQCFIVSYCIQPTQFPFLPLAQEVNTEAPISTQRLVWATSAI